MATDTSSDRPRKRGILFKLGIVLITLVVLLVVAFFVVTSSAFFKGVILPKVGASMNCDITVSSASIGLSEVTLNDLKLVPHGRDQLLQAQLVRTRYSLSDIIGGNIVVHELTLQSPVITIVKNDTDGTSNLDPLTQQKKPAAEEKKPATQQPTAKENKPPKIDITNVAIKNAQVTMTEKLKEGGQKVTQVSDFNFSVDRLQNGQSGKLQLSGNAKLDQPATKDAEASSLAATLAANFDYKLANDLAPESAKGDAHAQIASATGSYADFASAAVNLNCDLTPTQIQNLALQFQRSGNTLGELRVSGPFSAEKKEGKFNVDLIGLDKQVLNFAGAKQGFDFNNTKINSTNQIEITEGGNAIAVTGNFDASRFSVTKKAENQTTPPLDLNIAYQVNVDQTKQSALLQKLQITGVQNQQQILTGNLSRPMPVSWGQGAGVPDEAAFTLNVNNLNVADWKAFAADLNPSGAATVALNVVSRNAGKQLTLDLNTHLANFGAKFGSNQIANADIQLTFKGDVAEFKKVAINELQLKLAQQNQPSVTVAASGTVDSETKAADLKATIDANIPQLLQTVSVPNVSVSSGTATVVLNVSGSTEKLLKLDLNTHVANLDAKFSSNHIANADIQLTAKGQIEALKKIALSEYQLKLAQQDQTCVTLAGSGTVDTGTKAADLKATLEANLPQHMHTVSVPGVNLTSGDLKFDGHIVQSTNAQSVTGQLTLANLSGNLDKTKLDRLAAQMDADIAMKGADVNIKKLNGSLTQADQPAGNFDVNGTWNLSNKVGQITAKLAGFNERALGPFLEPSLGGKQLASVQIDGSASANMQSANAGTVSADLTVTNLLVRDPAHPGTNAPLNAHFVVDGSIQNSVLNLKGARIALSPTQRAKNELQLTGQVDLSKSNNIVANLTAHSDALDVTEWYDLYAKPKSTTKGQPQTAAAQPAPTATTSSANANTEPAPVHLPIQKATVDVSIGHLYLHDLDVIEKCTVNISDNSHVMVNPLEITINNAPIKASVDLDLSVSGYKYDITFSADKVPVGALADTFAPDSKGAYKGDLIANAHIKGIGTTGTSMRANLSGQTSIVLTNAQVKLTMSTRWSPFINGVSTLLRLPELSQVPINWIGEEMTFESGHIKISKLGVQSSVFTADSQGDIPIADVLTNSPLNMPLNLSLLGSWAKKASLAPANTSDTALVSLPKLVTITGTIGKPKEKINPLGVAATGLETVGGLLGNKSVSQGGSLLGGFLGGGKSAQSTTNATNTAPAPANSNQNKSSASDLFNAAKGLFGKPKK